MCWRRPLLAQIMSWAAYTIILWPKLKPRQTQSDLTGTGGMIPPPSSVMAESQPPARGSRKLRFNSFGATEVAGDIVCDLDDRLRPGRMPVRGAGRICRSALQRRTTQLNNPRQAAIPNRGYARRCPLDLPQIGVIGWRTTPKHLCFGRVSRCRGSPICRRQKAAERDSVQVSGSIPTSMLDSQSPGTQSVPRARHD
jgi:hypothetical protein